MALETELRSYVPPIPLSGAITEIIEGAARRRNVVPLRMASGALHDSSILAEITEVGMVFVPSRDGMSHCPEEFTEIEDIKLGADCLFDALVALSA